MKPLVFIFSLSSSFPLLPPSFAPVAFSFLSPALHQEEQYCEALFPHYNWYPLVDWHSAWMLSSQQLVYSSSLSLIMDQKVSLLISGIARREGAGHMLEPWVLHLWNADDHKLWEKQRQQHQTLFNECQMHWTMSNPEHHRTPWNLEAHQIDCPARTIAFIVPSAWNALPLGKPTACSLTSSTSLPNCCLSDFPSLSCIK